MPDKKVYIERDPKTEKYLIREGGEVQGTKKTQKEAINFAHKKFPEHKPLVERVRDTKDGKRDKWRHA